MSKESLGDEDQCGLSCRPWGSRNKEIKDEFQMDPWELLSQF